MSFGLAKRAESAVENCGTAGKGHQTLVGMSDVVGRFAPTPSGRMHIGNITAMLAAWLSVHALNAVGSPESCIRANTGSTGKIRLRIEDLDTPRIVPDADRWLMDDLDWLGLHWDGEPVYQSQRNELYEQALATLSPHIYPCFCSRADIRAASAPQEGDGFTIYPGTCRHLLRDHPDEVRRRLHAGVRHSLRLALPAAGSPDATMVVNDRVFGSTSWDLGRDLGDPVLRRSDGVIAYQLAVAVDDLDMGVTEIVRGRDLLRSSALQLWIRHALLPEPTVLSEPAVLPDPTFAHIPLIDDPAGHRLAKRKRSMDMGTLRAEGVSAEQIIGDCAWLLGVRLHNGDGQPSQHRHSNDRPVPMTAQEAAELFSWQPLVANHADRTLQQDWRRW